MAQNDKNSVFCTLYLYHFISYDFHLYTSYDHVFFVAQVWNDNISRSFFHFLKTVIFWFSGLLEGGGKRAKNGPKWQKILSHSVSQELYLMWLWFLVQIWQWWYLQFFSFCKNSAFTSFSKFINKCQTEILKGAPPSSHVCDFLYLFHSPGTKILINQLGTTRKECYLAKKHLIGKE